VAAVLAFRFRRRTGARRGATGAMVCCAILGVITATNSYVGYVRTEKDLALLLQRGGGPFRALGNLIDDGPAEPRHHQLG
jgi:hypothetical protein